MATHEPSIFDQVDDDADRRAEAEADADTEAGRVVPHRRVREWLKSVGTTAQSQTPYSWRK